MRRLVLLFCFGATLMTLSGCLYRMPEDDELHTVPATNHPDLTRQADSEWQPNVSY